MGRGMENAELRFVLFANCLGKPDKDSGLNHLQYPAFLYQVYRVCSDVDGTSTV
jgi:hypothetical protein